VYKDKKILAIIPARGGSKGLPKKNIKPLLGKPLIGWTIEQAKESKYIDEIFVSTDSKEIADVSECFGVKVPFLRPEELANDSASSMSVILYTIELLEKQGKIFDYVIMLEPTSPLRDSEDLDLAVEKLFSVNGAESIVGVCKVEAVHPVFLVSQKNGFIDPYVNKEYKVIRRQDLDELYFFEGSLYISGTESLKTRKSFYHEKCLPYIVPKWKSFEVDDEIDFYIIENLMKLKLNKLIN